MTTATFTWGDDDLVERAAAGIATGKHVTAVERLDFADGTASNLLQITMDDGTRLGIQLSVFEVVAPGEA